MCLIRRARTFGHKGMKMAMNIMARLQYRKLLHFYENLPRIHQESCWCGWKLKPLVTNPSWGLCQKCGSFGNLYPPNPDYFQEIYSLKPYWRVRANLHGVPDIAMRGRSYLSDGRVAFWLSVIEEYGPSKGRVVEVGCAPGILLQLLHERGYDCLGVELAEDTTKWLRDHTGFQIRTGIFPNMDLPHCDLFLALDVLEHSYNPFGFMKGIHDVLNPDGKGIIQTPIVRSDQNYDVNTHFDSDFERMCNDLHVFILSSRAIHQLAEMADLMVMNDRLRWYSWHEAVVLGRKCSTSSRRLSVKDGAMLRMRRLP